MAGKTPLNCWSVFGSFMVMMNKAQRCSKTVSGLRATLVVPRSKRQDFWI